MLFMEWEERTAVAHTHEDGFAVLREERPVESRFGLFVKRRSGLIAVDGYALAIFTEAHEAVTEIGLQALLVEIEGDQGISRSWP